MQNHTESSDLKMNWSTETTSFFEKRDELFAESRNFITSKKRVKQCKTEITIIENKMRDLANARFSNCQENHNKYIIGDRKYVDIIIYFGDPEDGFQFHTDNEVRCGGDTMTDEMYCETCGLKYQFGIICDGICGGGTVTLDEFENWKF